MLACDVTDDASSTASVRDAIASLIAFIQVVRL
jgi:hypothetical protein